MFQVACIVDPGANRAQNDDRAAVNGAVIAEGPFMDNNAASCLAVVCDGVGGRAFGGEAADIAAEIFSRLGGVKLNKDIIDGFIRSANEAVVAVQRTDSRHAHMATTIAGLYVNDSGYIAFNVGDSRVYRFRAPYLAQISKDHSVWQEQTDAGAAPRPEYKRVITRYLGGDYAAPEIVCGDGRALSGDLYMLCTDGVWGAISDDEIEGILSMNEGYGLDVICTLIIDTALRNGSDDNLSIIIVRRAD